MKTEKQSRIMEMKEWIKEQQRRYLDEPRLKELTEVMKQTRVLVRKKEYRKLSELVRRYRKSEDVITQVSCLLSASYLFPTPEKTAETDRSELMEALKDTYFMEKNGSRLMDIRPEEAVPVHRMLAMYTFMQDVYSKENPESKQERPSPQEVRSSVRILDFHRKESDMWELCNLAVHLMPPSRYVALRYGLADDYDRLDRLNRSGPEPAYDEGVILDFFLGGLMDQFIDWVYSQLVGFFGNFFAEMGNMGVELFEMSWVQSIVLFFSYLAWTLYVVGLVVAVFEVGIEYQTGRASIKDAAISAVKGFMAVGCFTLVPVELYKLSVTLQASLTSGITGYGESFDALSTDIINSLQGVDIGAAASSGVFGGIGSITSPIMVIFIIIMMGYAVIKCFFSNLKRGGVLLIQIAVGSLYMFSVPRGYMDGFVQWCKQIIGLCLTTFLQATILTAGLLVLKDHALLGLGLMLSAGEVPRICGAFGLDTSTRANIMSAVYAAQSAVNTTRTVVQAVGAAK